MAVVPPFVFPLAKYVQGKGGLGHKTKVRGLIPHHVRYNQDSNGAVNHCQAPAVGLGVLISSQSRLHWTGKSRLSLPKPKEEK
jgi:hypothetical protein